MKFISLLTFCILSGISMITQVSGQSNSDWDVLLDAQKDQQLKRWSKWVWRKKALNVVAAKDPAALKISSRSPAYSCKSKISFDGTKEYTFVIKMRVNSEGPRGNSKNAFLNIGGAMLWWESRCRDSSADGTVGFKVLGGSILRRLSKTDDGFHLYWITVKDNNIRIWLDDMKNTPIYSIKNAISSPQKKAYVSFGDDNGASGRTSFEIAWAILNPNTAVSPKANILNKYESQLKLVPAEQNKLAWKPWPLQGQIITGAWGAFGHAYGAWEKVKDNAMKAYKDAGMKMAMACNAEAIELGRKYGMQMLVTAQWGGLNKYPYWRKLTEKYDNNVGFQLWDEPQEKDLDIVAKRVKSLNERNPSRMVFVNLDCTFADPIKLENYISKVQPPVISFDFYPLFTNNRNRTLDYYKFCEIFRRAAQRRNIPWWAYVQCARQLPKWAAREPSESDLRWQIYSLLTYGSKGILYFYFFNAPHFQGGLVDENGKPSGRYNEVRKINEEIISMEKVLVTLESIDVKHVGVLQPFWCASMFKPNKLILKASADNALIGTFLNTQNGKLYLMITNKQFGENVKMSDSGQKITLTLSPKIKTVNRVGMTFVKEYWSFNHKTNELSVTLAPGNGILLELER
jgi:hypothetical protein